MNSTSEIPADSTPPAHHLSVLGDVRLSKRGGQPVHSVLAQPKRVALLTYLRLAGKERPVSRDAVVGVFWPDSPEDKARNALRQGIHFLRRSLGADALVRPNEHTVRVEPGTVGCDVVEFKRLIAERRHEEALVLYQGSFLEGMTFDGSPGVERWVESTRRSLANAAADAAAHLGKSALAGGEWSRAVEFGNRFVGIDPWAEKGVRLLVEAHAAVGDVPLALRAYEEFATRLAQDLGVRPSDAFSARVQELSRRAAATAPETVTIPADTQVLGAPSDVRVTPLRGGTKLDRRRAERVRRFAAGGALVTFALLGMRHAPPELALGRRAAESGPGPIAHVATGPSSGRPTVAVLPFANLSADGANGFFATGVYESLLADLSGIRAIETRAPSAVREVAEAGLTVHEMALHLRVGRVVTGSVQRVGDRIRIIVQLLDPESGEHVWAETFDRQVDDVLAVQREIARSLASSLEAALTEPEARRLASAPTRSVEALEGYMRGLTAYRHLSPKKIEEAVESFRIAVRADPTFAEAWTGLANSRLQQVQFFAYPLALADTALAEIERAIALDPELPEAHRALGFVHAVFGREKSALAAAQRTLALRPHDSNALNNAGWSYYSLGELEKAEAHILDAFEREPTIPQLRANVGAIWAALGRLDDAEAWLDDVLTVHPSLAAARNWRTYVDLRRGHAELALERAERDVRDPDASPTELARASFAAFSARRFDLAVAYAREAMDAGADENALGLRQLDTLLGSALVALGHDAQGYEYLTRAVAAVDRRVADGADGWDPEWERASAFAAMGDAEAALRHLRAAIREGFPHAALLRWDPAFDCLRSTPEFVAIANA